MSYTPATPQGIISTVNSTTTPLSSGITFSGTAELNDYSDVMVSVKTDQNGTYYMEFSTDGTNWDSSLSFSYDTTRINPPHVLVKGSRYFRIRFTNTSTSDQTYLRLEVSYGSYNKLTAPINGTLAETYDAITTRPTDFHHEVAASKRQGYTTWNKWGYNNDVDTGGQEVIASWGGTYTPPTTATTLSIVSTSANDITSTGTGLRSVVIYGIDANRLSQIEVVQMNGTTPVITTSTWLGINRVAPYLCGTSKNNEGTINITAVTGGATLSQMPLGESVSQQCIFHVQANHTFLATWIHVDVLRIGGGSDPVVTIRGFVYSPVANANIQVFKGKIDTAINNTIELKPPEPFPVTEQSVLYFTAETTNDNTIVDMRFSGIEQRNS
jgi:hypothetical protein